MDPNDEILATERDCRFSKEEHLLKGHEFRYMKTQGRGSRGSLLVLSWAEACDGDRRMGLVVSKKFDKTAVGRHRAQRLIREAFRQIKGRLKPRWYVFVARKYLAGKKTQDVQEEMLRLLSEAGCLIDNAEAEQ